MSYEEFYQLKEQPFSNAVDNRFYFDSNQHSQALLRLRHTASTMNGLAVLVGEVGAGKTTLARKMLDSLDENEYESALLVIIHSSINSTWLLRKIAVQLGAENLADDKIKLLGQLYERLLQIHESKKKTVVLIDEAQMLQTKEIMEDFRGLLNLEASGMKLITFIFFALPEIDNYLSLDKPLNQRISLKYKLVSLKRESTKAYIKHRLNIAGVTDDLFTDSAIDKIHEYSRGTPRIINVICDNALFEGFLIKKLEIDANIIKDVAFDLGLIKIPEIRNAASLGAEEDTALKMLDEIEDENN